MVTPQVFDLESTRALVVVIEHPLCTLRIVESNEECVRVLTENGSRKTTSLAEDGMMIVNIPHDGEQVVVSIHLHKLISIEIQNRPPTQKEEESVFWDC